LQATKCTQSLIVGNAIAEQSIAHESEVRNVLDRQRDGFKLFVYTRWFTEDGWRCKNYFTFHLFEGNRKAFAQFRMGAHWLNTESIRWFLGVI
jgi:hypothetical protein